MKLRLKGNSIRLRLTRSDVERLSTVGRVEEFVEFGDNSRFVFALHTRSDESSVTATFDGATIRVSVPDAVAREWAGSDAVTIDSEDQAHLRILIEKDFACLSPRRGEDESDMFHNPASVPC